MVTGGKQKMTDYKLHIAKCRLENKKKEELNLEKRLKKIENRLKKLERK